MEAGKDICLNRVSIAYGKQQVLRDVDLRFAAGKITAVMGPSGLGKTTILRILMGLQPYEGEVTGLEGKKISCVFQDSRLLPWLTVRQNLELVCGAEQKAIDEALALTELQDAAQKKPEELSGGMQRRAALARALAYSGDVFLLDEPFTGLDEDLKERIAERVTKQWRAEKKTVLFVTHVQAEADRWADEVIRLTEVPGVEPGNAIEG